MPGFVYQPNTSSGVTKDISKLLRYPSKNYLQKLINSAPLLTHADLALLV